MRPLAATAIFLFGIFHVAPVLPWLTQPQDSEAGDDSLILRVPQWARFYWLFACLTAVVGSVLVALGQWVGVAIAGLGMAEICGLAIANGFWMKGRPTVSHHAIRIAIAIGLLGVAAASLSS